MPDTTEREEGEALEIEQSNAEGIPEATPNERDRLEQLSSQLMYELHGLIQETTNDQLQTTAIKWSERFVVNSIPALPQALSGVGPEQVLTHVAVRWVRGTATPEEFSNWRQSLTTWCDGESSRIRGLQRQGRRMAVSRRRLQFLSVFLLCALHVRATPDAATLMPNAAAIHGALNGMATARWLVSTPGSRRMEAALSYQEVLPEAIADVRAVLSPVEGSA